MTVRADSISLSTRGMNDTHDVTGEVQRAVADSGVTHGTVTVFCPGSTCGVTTIEFEPGVVGDLGDCLDRIAPRDIPYAHDAAWGDGNGFSHVRSSLVGPSLTVPIVDGALTLGTWQQIVLIDFDNRPRRRRLVVQIMGE
ncbi:YjbQ family protein [Candidatus Sumerlaeota bacterium]|nr:YjbQ family protein [Candidatus Sumerlaeota bacterium]